MINKIPELKKLELNKQNVMEVLFKYKPTQNSKTIITANFYSKQSTRKAPPIQLDRSMISQYTDLLRYWLGQIQDLHQQKDRLTPAAGIFDYKGKKWTDDNRALFALYYLVTTSIVFPVFEDGPNGAETCSLKPYYQVLKPTFAPNDPNFKLEDARKALADLGVKLPDDLSQFD